MTNGNGIWKYVAVTAISILIGMGVRAMNEPKDIVSEKELTMQVVQLQGKIDTLSNEVAALRQSVNQQSVDIARMAQQVGTTAHPVTAPQSRQP